MYPSHPTVGSRCSQQKTPVVGVERHDGMTVRNRDNDLSASHDNTRSRISGRVAVEAK
jgi:hypothetical protein